MENREGQNIPQVTFRTRENHQWVDVSSSDIFKDKTVIVTGGGTGRGRETALLFAQQGTNVVIIGRRIDKLRQVQKETINCCFNCSGPCWSEQS